MWMCFEAGKSWIEADADVAEAIDFLEFYGREMLRLGGPQPVDARTRARRTSCVYIPLGVGVVIPPWNFPLAIMCRHDQRRDRHRQHGRAEAGQRDARSSPRSSSRSFEEAGLPPGVLNFLPGSGGEIGDTLVEHPQTRFICVHRLDGGRPAHLRAARRRSQPGPDLAQAHDPGDGRQGPHRRRRDRRPGRRGRGDRRRRVRLPGAEVLGVLARDRASRASTTRSLEKVVERAEDADASATRRATRERTWAR